MEEKCWSILIKSGTGKIQFRTSCGTCSERNTGYLGECKMIQLRVLHIMPGFGGGISSHVRNIIRGVDKEKIIIDVAGFTDYPDFFIGGKS